MNLFDIIDPPPALRIVAMQIRPHHDQRCVLCEHPLAAGHADKATVLALYNGNEPVALVCCECPALREVTR